MNMDHRGTELMLPTQFLSEDDEQDSPTNKNFFAYESCSSNQKSCELSLGFNSNLSSPDESELGSCELGTDRDEDDDDDYIAEMSREMARYMLQEDDSKFDIPSIDTRKFEQSCGLVGSPQSTLRSPLASSQGSPKGASQEPSPPLTPVFGKNRVWNSKYSYAHRPNLISESVTDDQKMVEQREQVVKREASSYMQKRTNLSQQCEPKEQFQQFQMKGRASGKFGNGGWAAHPHGFSSSTWYASPMQQQQQQQPDLGSRAVFLGGSGSRNGSCGTGVFLPRGISNSSYTRKKQTPAILIPARVVQALKLHFDKTGGVSRSNSSRLPFGKDALTSDKNVTYSLRNTHSQTVPASTQNGIGLPREWTY